MANQPYTPETRALNVNFYHLKSDRKFDVCLQDIGRKGFEDRIVEMRGMRYRMREVRSLKGGQLVAEFRKLRTRASGEVPRKEHLKSGDEEEFNLGAEEAFAECTAILYDSVSRCLLVQRADHAMGVVSIVACVERACALSPSTFDIEPVWKRGFLEDIQKSGHISKFEVHLSHDPLWLTKKSEQELPVDPSFELLRELAAQDLVLKVSIERQKGASLSSSGVMKFMDRWLARRDEGRAEVDKARINVRRGAKWRWLDLFKHRLTDTEKVELTAKGDTTFMNKSFAIEEIWKRHEEALRERYKPDEPTGT